MLISSQAVVVVEVGVELGNNCKESIFDKDLLAFYQDTGQFYTDTPAV